MTDFGLVSFNTERNDDDELGDVVKREGFGRREREKTNTLFITLRRHLIHLFSCRRFQMWFADCRLFASEKTNTTLVSRLG
ncbi:hypothetical protein Hanom_Chr15g01368541 [Helianthus anomalus]